MACERRAQGVRVDRGVVRLLQVVLSSSLNSMAVWVMMQCFSNIEKGDVSGLGSTSCQQNQSLTMGLTLRCA